MDANPIFIFLMVIVLLGVRPRTNDSGLSINSTQMLKGVAMLLIVLAHLGWFLLSDNKLLQPWSNYAGIGVDLFLFLSGYGLLAAEFKRPLKPLEFYRKRLLRLFIPLWVILVIFFILDKLVLGVGYGFTYVLQSFVGIFNSADIYKDFNSPLWYFTFILLYYITFPWVVIKSRWWLAVLFWGVGGYLFTRFGFPFFSKVNGLHTLHYLAFPLGFLVAGLQNNFGEKIQKTFAKLSAWPHSVIVPIRLMLVAGVFVGVKYFADLPINSSGLPIERQLVSIAAVMLIVILAVLLPMRFRLLELVGWCSFEIYLIHWPLALRYDLIFARLPEELATLVYLAVLVILACGFKWVLDKGMTLLFQPKKS